MWNQGNYSNELQLTKEQARIGSHQGSCDRDISDLRTIPAIRRQLAKLNPDTLRKELEGYGAWGEVELSNHDENLSRWLWISCGNIVEALAAKR